MNFGGDAASQRATATVDALQPLTAAFLECVTPAEVVATVVERGIAILGASAGLAALVTDDGESLEVIRTSGYSDAILQGWERFRLVDRLPLSDAVRENTILWFESGADWRERYPEMMSKVKEGYFRASATLPLTVRGQVFGGLHFSFPSDRSFSQTDKLLLGDLARQCALALDRALLFERVERARDEAQNANRRLSFLAEASALLAESLDYLTRLEELAHLCVPYLADWAGVDVLGEDGAVVRLAVAHRNPERETVMRDLQRRYPPDPQQGASTLTVLHTGERLFYPDIAPELIEARAVDAEHARLLKQIGIRAALSLPLTARGRTLGVLTLGMGPVPEGSGRSFTAEVIALAEDLARRAAIAVDNARVVVELEKVNLSQQNSLQRSEERFRLLVEGVQDYAIFLLDPNGIVTTWNAGAQRFKGYKAEEIIGRHFSQFYTEEDIARRHPWNELEIAAREGRYEEEGWRIRKDGTRFWASVVITALRDEMQILRGFGKVTRDITERRRYEQERATAQVLEQQQRFLKDVLSSVTLGKLVLCDTANELPAPLSSNPAGGKAIVLSARALKTVRARVVEVARQCALPREQTQDLITAVSECAMNAVVHAGDGTATVYGSPESGSVQVWVEDKGKGIDLSNLPRATLEPGFSTGGVGIGHGFSLMLATVRRVYLLTGAKGTSVVLEQGRVPQEPFWLHSFK